MAGSELPHALQEEAQTDSMRRTVLVLSLLFLSMGASTWLLNLIEQHTSAVPRQVEAPRTLAAAQLTAVTDSVR